MLTIAVFCGMYIHCYEVCIVRWLQTNLKIWDLLQGLIAHDAVRGCDWTALKSARDPAQPIVKQVIPTPTKHRNPFLVQIPHTPKQALQICTPLVKWKHFPRTLLLQQIRQCTQTFLYLKKVYEVNIYTFKSADGNIWVIYTKIVSFQADIDSIRLRTHIMAVLFLLRNHHLSKSSTPIFARTLILFSITISTFSTVFPSSAVYSRLYSTTSPLSSTEH